MSIFKGKTLYGQSLLQKLFVANYISNFRQECQSYKLTVEDPVSLEYITRHVAGMKQRYTQSSGRRPFGISCLLTGKLRNYFNCHCMRVPSYFL